MDEVRLAQLIAAQDGVVSRCQVLALGGTDDLIERRLRRREWARVHPGVYVDHTGPPSWSQLAWAGVLYAAPAVLSGHSALRAGRVRGHEGSGIQVAVQGERRVGSVEGLKVERISDFDRVALTHLSPPRLRVEAALLRVAARASSDDASVAVLADACQSGATTSARLLVELRHLPKLRRRRLLLAVLEDVAVGAHSALERRYLVDVERPHGLPRGRRQEAQHSGDRRVRRDVEYVALGTFVELDGRLGHEWAAGRWADLDRDLAAAATGRITVRLGWGQVLQPCRLALSMGQLLSSRGWEGTLRPCGPTCLVVRR